MATVLSGAAVKRHFAVVNPSAARRAALENTVVRLREGFRKKGLGSSSSFSEGVPSSAIRSSSVEAAQAGVALEAMSRGNFRQQLDMPFGGFTTHQGLIAAHHGSIGVIEECAEGSSTPSPIDYGKTSGGLQGVGVVEEKDKVAIPWPVITPELDSGMVFSERNGLSDRYRPYVPDLTHSLESFTSFQGPVDQLDNLALMFQERLNDPRVTSMLRADFRRRGQEQDLTTLLEDKGLDPNFAVMLKEKGLDPTLLALLQRSSLDADRDRRDNTDVGTGGNPSQNNPPEEAISYSEELRRKRWDRWLESGRFLVELFAGTPERAWVLFSVIFIQETIMVAIFRPQSVTVINSTHEQVSQ